MGNMKETWIKVDADDLHQTIFLPVEAHGALQASDRIYLMVYAVINNQLTETRCLCVDNCLITCDEYAVNIDHIDHRDIVLDKKVRHRFFNSDSFYMVAENTQIHHGITIH